MVILNGMFCRVVWKFYKANIIDSRNRGDIIGTKFYDIDYHRVVSHCGTGETATGEIGCFIMETMRLVSSNVAGARVSRFPRRKRGINSRASVVRRRSRRWYLAFKPELFTLFPTSRHSSPFTYGISGKKERNKENEKGRKKGQSPRDVANIHIYLNKGRCPKRAQEPRICFQPPLSFTSSCRL